MSGKKRCAKAKSREAESEATREANHAKEEGAAAKKQVEQADEDEQRRHHYAAWLTRNLWTGQDTPGGKETTTNG